MKDVLIQPDIDGKRAKWIAKLTEFGIEVKPNRMVKGQGLAKLMAKENYDLLGMNFIGISSINLQTEGAAEEQHESQQVAENLSSCEWYSGIIHFLQNLEVPPRISMTQAWALKLKSVKFCIVKNLLYWKDPSGILLRCLDKSQFKSCISSIQEYVEAIITRILQPTKILRDGYYWIFLFSNVCTFVKACDKCQRFIGKQHLKSFPLRPIVVNGPFQY